MGADHARTIDRRIAGASVVAIADFDHARAVAVASEMRDAVTFADGRTLIDDDGVDAVIIASHDSTHKELVLAALAAGKPVLCEKPLAPTAVECREVIDADAGRGLVSVGFMRRFDPSYMELRRRVLSGEIGDALLAHCVSRTVDTWPGGDSASTITNSAIHELDVVPWLLDSPIAEVSWHAGRTSRNSGSRQDPQIMLLRTESDILVTVEVFLNARYGYDTRCEVVGEIGTAALTLPSQVVVDRDRTRSVAYPADWIPRYADAYRIELQEWVDSIDGGRPSELASALDGLAAGLVADALVISMNERRTVRVER
ncbi:inositol 2-dehydrogenase [Rhodococcoides trifolii]|uniref:Inositol 2-dehydrogenase n=2 Tax=Rhodococcoides trifolii TaxID=908250 RepID=A0A917FW06_9NOCA|nr:inositol 2-dehydrogenase [Rhodococcus trifolii]